ncbi:MAG: glycosyltransferase family 9 protein, partial [Bacteroidota bacterium]
GDRYVLWSFFSAAKFRVGPIKNNLAFLLTHKANVYENRINFMDYYLEIARTFGAEADSRQTDFVLNPAFSKCVDDYFSEKNILESDKIICIHPGAGESSRKWKLDNYPLLVKKIIEETEYKIIFTIGPQEHKHRTIFEPLTNSRVLIHYSENVHELAWVINKAALLIGMDSGARHLAAALNIPSLALFPEDMIAAWWFYKEENKQFYLAGKRNNGDKENQFLDKINVETVFEKAVQILKMKWV